MNVVVIVDDSKADRYTIKRRLSKLEGTSKIIEYDAGDTFLEDFFQSGNEIIESNDRLLVVMDINMPRLNGFETVAGMQSRVGQGQNVDSCVVMMFSSSDNPKDREMAASFDLVQGYIVKPFDQNDLSTIQKLLT